MADVVINAEVKSNIGEVGKDASSAASEFKVMGVSLNGMKAGFASAGQSAKMMFGSIKAGIISSGIGALLLAVLALGKYFTSTEEGASKLKQVFAALGIIVGNLEDVLSALGKGMVEAFENPQQAVKDLWEAIKTNLVNRVEGLVDSFGALGKVIKGAFTLDWDAMKEGASEFGESMIQTATGVDDLFGKAVKSVKEFGAATRKEMGEAVQLEKDLLALQQKERKILVDKSKNEMEIAELRANARDLENFTSRERLKMSEEAIALSKKQLEIDLEIAEEKLRQQQLANSFSNSNAEDLNAEAQLEANLYNLKKTNFALMKGFAGELKAVNAEIRNEEKAAQKLIDDAKDKQVKKDIDDAKIVADAKIKEDNRIAKEKQDLDKLIEDTKQSTIKNGFAMASSLAKEGSDMAKGIAVAETIYNTQQGIMTAMTLPPPFNAIQAGITGVMGAAAIAKIISTNPSAGGGGGGGGSAAVAQTPAPQMMSGAFDISGGVAPEATRAYVVTDEMSNSQAQLANIRRRATI